MNNEWLSMIGHSSLYGKFTCVWGSYTWMICLLFYLPNKTQFSFILPHTVAPLKKNWKNTLINQFGIFCGKFTVWDNFFKTIYESVCACVIIRKKSEIKCTYKVANYWHVLVSLKKIDLIQNKSWLHSWDFTFGSYHPSVQMQSNETLYSVNKILVPYRCLTMQWKKTKSKLAHISIEEKGQSLASFTMVNLGSILHC